MIRWARRPTRARILAVLCALLMVLPAGLSASAGQTEASWVDSEHGQGRFSAKVVLPPIITTCEVGTTILGVINSVWVEYKVPAGYSSTDVKWSVGTSTGGMTAGSAAITDRGNGVYRATFSQSILQDLLGMLLSALFGQSFYIAAYTGGPSDGGWTSTPPIYSRVSVGLLGLSSSCTVTP